MSFQVLEAMLTLFYQARDAVRKKNQPRLWRETKPDAHAAVEAEGPHVALLQESDDVTLCDTMYDDVTLCMMM